MLESLTSLGYGFTIALQPQNLLYCLIGFRDCRHAEADRRLEAAMFTMSCRRFLPGNAQSPEPTVQCWGSQTVLAQAYPPGKHCVA